MIAYLKGKLINIKQNKIVLLTNDIGYEVLLPAFLLNSINSSKLDEEIEVYIYYHQTEKQPKPTLIGFKLEIERAFFERFISVDAIGPIKAVNALDSPISEIAKAIETKDIARLEKLKGIGKRSAEKIVAALKGTLNEFILVQEGEVLEEAKTDLFTTSINSQVLEVLVNQLGYKHQEATTIIQKARVQKPEIRTAEELFDEIYNVKK